MKRRDLPSVDGLLAAAMMLGAAYVVAAVAAAESMAQLTPQ